SPVRAPKDVPREAPSPRAPRGPAGPRGDGRGGRATPGRARRRAAGDDAGALRDRPASAPPAGAGERLGRRLSGCLPTGRSPRLLQGSDLLLELRDARLERVDPANLLRHVVDPRAEVVHGGERLLPARELRDALESLFTPVREARYEVLLARGGLGLARRRCRHGTVISPVAETRLRRA